MTQVIEAIEQALQEQDIDKVYEHYHRFFDNFDPEKDLQEMADLATYSVSIGFYEEAKRALLRLTEVEPDEAIWTILLAEILVAEGETDPVDLSSGKHRLFRCCKCGDQGGRYAVCDLIK